MRELSPITIFVPDNPCSIACPRAHRPSTTIRVRSLVPELTAHPRQSVLTTHHRAHSPPRQSVFDRSSPGSQPIHDNPCSLPCRLCSIAPSSQTVPGLFSFCTPPLVTITITSLFQKKRPDRRAFAIEQGPHTYVGEPLEGQISVASTYVGEPLEGCPSISVANDNNHNNHNKHNNNNKRSPAAPTQRLGRGKIPLSSSPPPPPFPSRRFADHNRPRAHNPSRDHNPSTMCVSYLRYSYFRSRPDCAWAGLRVR